MQNSPSPIKAWLKISYDQQSYEPVIVLRKIDQIKSLVIDDFVDTNQNSSYQVQTSMLVPRGDYVEVNDIQQLTYLNYPEVLQKLSQTSGADRLQRKKYISIGKNIIVDMNSPSHNVSTNYQDRQLQNFFKYHITDLTSSKKQQKIMLVVSQENTNPHYYINNLIQFFNGSIDLWPYSLKLHKLHIIIQKLLSDVSLQLKIGFAQNKNNDNSIVTNTIFMHFKPYVPILPAQKFAIPQKLLKLTFCQKFHKMYKGPTPINSQNSSSTELQAIIEAFISLGVEIKMINSIFKLLSIIANLNAMKVQDEEIEISNIFKDQVQFRAVFPEFHDNNLDNICSLLQMKADKIEDLILEQQIDHPLVNTSQQQSDSVKNVASRKKSSNYRLHIFKFILYEMMITKICDIVNKKIFSQKFINEALINNRQFSNKYLIVLSYGISLRHDSAALYPNQVLDQMDDYIKQRLSLKILNIIKENIIHTINYNDSHLNNDESKSPTHRIREKITTDYFFPTKNSKQRIQQLTNNISYKAQIQKQITCLSSFFTSRILQARTINLLNQQLSIYSMYCHMSEFMIFSEISMKLFFDTTKKAILKELPYIFYQYLWPVFSKTYQERQQQRSLIVITNNKFIIQDQSFVKKIQNKVLKEKKYKSQKQINKQQNDQQNRQEFVQKIQTKNQHNSFNKNNQLINKPSSRPYETPIPQNKSTQQRKYKQNQQNKQQSKINTPLKTQKQPNPGYSTITQPLKIQNNPKKLTIGTNNYQPQVNPKETPKVISTPIDKRQYKSIKKNQVSNLQPHQIQKQTEKQKEHQKSQNQNLKQQTVQSNINKIYNSEPLNQIKPQIQCKQPNDKEDPQKNDQPQQQNKQNKLDDHNQLIKTESIIFIRQQSIITTNKQAQKPKEQAQKSAKPSNIVISPINTSNNVNQSGKKMQQNKMNLSNKSKQNAKSDFLTSPRPFKKNQSQLLQKSQNLEELSRPQFVSIRDLPSYTLQQWEKKSKLKFLPITSQNKCLFTKYGSMSERISAKIHKSPKPAPDEEIITTFLEDNYLDRTKQLLDCNNNQQIQTQMLSNQGISKITKPLLKAYPIKLYPDYYKSAFNSILKIGQQKNTTRTLHKLLNQIAEPLIKSYYEEIQKAKNLFDEQEVIPCNYSSAHNIIKDEVFIYFVKQITNEKRERLPQRNMNAYLFGLCVFTRYFCPSPIFLYPFTHYIYFLHKFAIQKNRDKVYIDYLESIFENLLFFIQASQGFRRNPVQAFVQQTDRPKMFKNQLQCAQYLHLRKTPISQIEINRPPKGQKPQPAQITVWLVNNQSFIFPVRNEIVKTLKKKVLAQLGFLQRQQCFSLYFLQKNLTYTVIDDRQKVVNLLAQINPHKPKEQRRSIYLKIRYYFPFSLKDLNCVRLIYMNMISEEVMFPWKAQNYQYVVAQSLAYEDYQQLRIGNYLIFTNQTKNKNPNLDPIKQKLKYIQQDKKICQYEYMKHLKQMSFFLSKFFRSQKNSNYVIGIKPQEIVFFENNTLICSIDIKRIYNAYIQDNRIVLQIYYKNSLTKGQQQQYERLRILKIQHFQQTQQLFKTILFHLQNNIHSQN